MPCLDQRYLLGPGRGGGLRVPGSPTQAAGGFVLCGRGLCILLEARPLAFLPPRCSPSISQQIFLGGEHLLAGIFIPQPAVLFTA